MAGFGVDTSHWAGCAAVRASWQLRQSELGSPPRSRKEPGPGIGETGDVPELPRGLCIVWQPSHGPTPPSWKARAGPAMDQAVRPMARIEALRTEARVYTLDEVGSCLLQPSCPDSP